MRPDAHKQAASRRYNRNKDASIPTTTTTTTTTTSRQQDNPNNDTAEKSLEETDATTQYGRSRYSRRKLESNASRYQESDSDEESAADAESGIDRETKDLLSLLKNAEKEDFDPTTYFQLKSDRDWKEEDGEGMSSSMYRDLLDIPFDELDAALDMLPLHERMGTDEQTAIELTKEIQSGKMPLPPLVPMTVLQDALLLALKPKKKEQVEEDDESLFLEEDRQKKPNATSSEKETPRTPKSVSFVKPGGAVTKKSDAPAVTNTPYPRIDPNVPMGETLVRSKKKGLESELDYLLLLDGKSSDVNAAKPSKSIPKLSASKPQQRKPLPPTADNDDLLDDLLNS